MDLNSAPCGAHACKPYARNVGADATVTRGQQGEPYEDEGKYVPSIQVTFVRETGEELERMVEDLPGESLIDNRWTRLYEEELGIQIRYDWIATGDVYNQKLG